MSSTRITREGHQEYEYAWIRDVDGEIVEDRFWSPMRYPSHLSRFYVRTDDIENLEIKRSIVRRQIDDRKTTGFLSSLTLVDPVIEPAPAAPSNIVPLPIRRSSTILQRYAARAISNSKSRPK